MAKAVILDVLESTIGRYVLNLDTNSLNVAVWSGKIELSNLKLNVEAVNRKLARKAAESPNLAIPFRVVDGSFSSIKLEVPWTRLTSRPVVFRAEGLQVLLEPYDHLAPTTDVETGTTDSSQTVDESSKPKKKKNPRIKSLKYAEEERQRFNAMKKLAVLDLDSAQAVEEEKDPSASSSFGARLARRIIENLQFEIEGVHLSIQGEGFFMGVQLDQLSLVTTDEMGNRSFIDRVSSSKEKSFLYKALAIHGFGIYCNEVFGGGHTTSHSYILSPLSFDAKLRQSDCPKCIEFPKYLLSSQLEIVSIIVTRKQLEIIHNISTRLSIQLNTIRPLFPQYRPDVAVSRETAKLWWKYAIRCVGRLNRTRSWTEFYVAFQKRKQYIQLYKRSAHSSTCNWMNPLSSDETSQLDGLDMDRSISIDGIMNWRSLADAQAELEQKKRKDAKIEAKAQAKRKSMMSSIFGKKKSKKKTGEGGDSLKESDSVVLEEASPIDLTVEELKELELMAMSEASTLDSSLSTDSKLCDVKFRLGSFKVDIITFENRPLAALEMGTTSITFLANADGSFSCEFSLTSLNIQDKVTIGSLFPLVVRSLQKSSKLSSMNNAMEIRFQKEKTGDQGLIFKMVAYEIVPSSFLIKEFQQFLTFSNERSKVGLSHLQNPVLQTSISGADLFYDTYNGSIMSDPILKDGLQRPSAMKKGPVDAGVGFGGRTKRAFVPNPTDRLTAALTDAWENKLIRKTKWSVELVIHAPIFVIPKSSTDPLSSVLSFDLGNFHFLYGNIEASDSVRNWYETQSLNTADSDSFDFCRLEMQHLSFVIGTAANRDTSKVRDVEKRKISSETIIEPISFSISVGIANASSMSQLSRSCLFGVLPAITLRLSYSQISRILSVVACWVEVLESLKTNQNIIILDDEIAQERDYSQVDAPSSSNDALVSPFDDFRTAVLDTTHINFKLNKLSLIICSEDDESVEAHLVSAEATHISRSDKSTTTNIKMGFFWVIDKLHYPQMPRRQRFLIRSSLPKAARYLETQTHGESYVMQELDSLAASRVNMLENESLADITISNRTIYDGIIDSRLPLGIDERPSGTVVVAKFHSLFINWNPTAVRSLILFERKITDLADKLLTKSSGLQNTPKMKRTLQDATSSVVKEDSTNNKDTSYAEINIKARKREHVLDTVNSINDQNRKDIGILFSLQAEMKSFEITLNSARDDLPLYTLKMSGTRVSFLSLNGRPVAIVKVVVGDVRLELPSTGKTLDNYSAILGLSPDQSSSLISAVYYKGSQVIQRDPSLPHEKNVDAVMTLNLSPMRFVYVQAQIMTLVEYITQGIVGAITQEATTDTMHPVEKQKSGESIFIIGASGFDIIVPESAYSKSNFNIHCGEFGVNFRLFTRPGQGEAKIYVKNVTIEGEEEGLVKEPIQLYISLLLGPLDTANEEEKALTLDLEISRVSFILTRRHYAQLMLMVDKNIGEDDPFLRDAEFAGFSISKDEKLLTHGGVQVINIQRRINVNCRSEAVVLDICGMSVTNPLATIAALETVVIVQLIHDDKIIRVFATMSDLTCEDRRFVAFNRSFRYIVKQVTNNKKRDVLKLDYEKSKITGNMNINLAIGSPQIAVVPDAIVDIKSFFALDADPKKRMTDAHEELGSVLSNINLTHDETSVEASMHGSATVSDVSRALNLSFRTDDVRLVFIDMGCKIDDVTASIRNTPLTETIVCQGKSEALVTLSYDTFDSLLSTNIQLHGERIEIYSASGRDLLSPVQIMEPLKFSLFINSLVCGGRQETDVSFVTLSTLDMSVSMQNIALFQAILTTMSDSFTVIPDSDSRKNEILSTLEASQIEKISRALENQELLESDSYQVAGFENSVRDIIVDNDQKYSSDAGKSVDRKLTIKLTLPEVAIIVINDLQGLDEALFKLIIQECVFMLDTAMTKSPDPPYLDRSVLRQMSAESSTLLFYSQMNASISADYYDRNSWRHLLVKPWEINIKATRGKSQRFTSRRMMTAVDVESHPCCVDFSEQFIISLGAATSMWTVYSGATKKAIGDNAMPLTCGLGDSQQRSKNTVKSMALNAARSLITTMPYGLNNRCGLVVDFEVGMENNPTHGKRYKCAPGNTEYFRFEPRKRAGSGGWRSYGQDVDHNKSVLLFIAGVPIQIEHIDKEVGSKQRAHDIGQGRYVFSEVTKFGKTTVLHLSSYVDIRNETSMSFTLRTEYHDSVRQVGLLQSRTSRKKQRSVVSQSATTPTVTDTTNVLGLPIDLFFSEGEQDKDIQLYFSTDVNGSSLSGVFHLPSRKVFRRLTLGGKLIHIFELLLSSDPSEAIAVSVPASRAISVDQMVLCIICKITIVDYIHPIVEMYVRPRARLENKLNVDISVQTPMPHTYSGRQSEAEDKMTFHSLGPFDSIEIFTRGPSVAAKFKCATSADYGDTSDWTVWMDIPLGLNRSLAQPIRGCFPFIGQSGVENRISRGNVFSIIEENGSFDSTNEDNVDPGVRTLSVAAENLGIDHTGEIVFQAYFTPEQQRNRMNTARMNSNGLTKFSFSAFPSAALFKGKISLLPDSTVPLRIVTIATKSRKRKSLPFLIEDIAWCNGGLESTPIFWDDETSSGYFAYRKLSLLSKMELHIIPSFVIYNGGNDPVVVLMSHSEEIQLGPGEIAPLPHNDHHLGLIVQLQYIHQRLITSPVNVESLGSTVSLTKKVPSGAAVGSVTLQTVIGYQDSCFVVNLGSIKYGRKPKNRVSSWFSDDFLRLRIRWSMVDVSFNDTARAVSSPNGNIQQLTQISSPRHFNVVRILLERFTIDFQRIFKAEEVFLDEKSSPERSQFSMIMKNVTITDCISNTIVLQSSSNILQSTANNGNFFDLCIRTRGSEDSGIILVDLFDLKLSQANGLAVPLIINTNEAFLWSLIDIASRTKVAIAEISGVDMELSWDESKGEYSVSIIHVPIEERALSNAKGGVYRPPASDSLLSVRVASVSPVSFRLSFKRQPQKSRYAMGNQVEVGANLLNYFTTRLKFTVDNAELKFPGYIQKQIKGPPDHILEEIKTFYLSQVKLKLLHLVTATSFDDWKELVGREIGTEGYVEGDILRLTGNLAGRSANFLLKRVGTGIGSGVQVGSEALGSGIQVFSEALGVGAVGAGVNSVVSGLGEGVGKSVASIGVGTGKVLKGAGKGLGHVVGGVGGGLEQIAKGISKGVISGDGRLIVEGLGGGALSVGAGLVEGADSLVTGAAEGVISAGKGLFDGVQSLGKGIGGIFFDPQKDKKKSSHHFNR